MVSRGHTVLKEKEMKGKKKRKKKTRDLESQIHGQSGLLRKALDENGCKLQYSKLYAGYLYIISPPVYGPLGKEP